MERNERYRLEPGANVAGTSPLLLVYVSITQVSCGPMKSELRGPSVTDEGRGHSGRREPALWREVREPSCTRSYGEATEGQ